MQINDLRKRLWQRRTELQNRVSRVESDLRRESDPLVGDFADQAMQRANDTVLGAIGLTAEDELRQIDQALQRIAEKRYDSCSTCGAHIGIERLAAVPYTNQCAPCATAVSPAARA